MADGIDNERLERSDWAQDRGVLRTLLEIAIAMALLFGVVQATVLGILTF